MTHYLRALMARLRGLFGDRRADREFDDEIEEHLRLLTERYVRQGITEDEAIRAARRQFGNVTLLQEAHRDMRGIRFIDTLFQDLRFGVRMLLKSKGFTAVAVLSLALGIGANTAIFSVANTILLQPLPIKDAERIVDVRSYTPREAKVSAFSYPDYFDLRKLTGNTVDLFAISGVSAVLGTSDAMGHATAENEAEEVRGLLVSGTYFSALGGNALLGRTLKLEDDQAAGAHPVVVLSHGFWQRRFGALPNVVGQTILLNARAFTIVGVAEPNFHGVDREAPDVWAPLLMRDQFNAGDNLLSQRNTIWLNVMGRLQPGVSRQQAEAALELAFSQMKSGRPEFVRNLQIKLYSASLLSPNDRRIITPVASVALGAVTLVMLIACLNVAGLMLARMAARQREIAVRLSIGASRGRLLRQLFTESLLLAGVSGLAGLLISRWAAQALSVPLEEFAPRGIGLDWRVIAYTMGVSVLTAVVVGLLPAWQTTRFNLIQALKQEAAGFNQRSARVRLRSMLVVGQIAISLVLLASAGLFARALMRAMTIDPGFETNNLSFVEFNFQSFVFDETRAAQFQSDLQERLVALPMVKDVVWVAVVPLGGSSRDSSYGPDGRKPLDGEPRVSAANNVVSPNYFAALGIPLLYGRTFSESEIRSETAVVVINEALARRHWSGENPIGKYLWIGDRAREIIGVAKDTRNTRLNVADEPYFYLPAPLRNRLGLQLLVKSDADPGALAETLRTTIRSLAPKLNIEINSLADEMKEAYGPLRLGTTVAGLFGVLALALAAMGLYGVMAFMVGQRTREIGVRMALGAQSADVVRLMLRQGLRLVIIGVALGLAISVAATRVIAAALYGVSPTDPLTFSVITLLLGMVASLACWIPARWATKVDPLQVLRRE
jgi:macrolide transport system ATP-binding/permease protein